MPALQLESSPQVEAFIDGVRGRLMDLPLEKREELLQQARARVELTLDLEAVSPTDTAAVSKVLAKLGGSAELAKKLRADVPSVEAPTVEPAPPHAVTTLAACRTCKKEVSEEALSCPHCGAPFPTRVQWRGRGYEWKSKTHVFGLPLVHVAVGRDEKGKLRVAKGIIAIGQFGIGVVTIAQFGVAGLFGIGQFMLAPIALGQFAFGLVAAGQFGIGLLAGAGQFATGWLKAIGMITFGPK